MIHRIENLRCHLKRKFETELSINLDGTSDHVPCVDHCLSYAFGECTNKHNLRCENCNEFFILFADLEKVLPEQHLSSLCENKDKLSFFWAHQARKTYLNSQLNANLLELDEKGAILIADYKMRILPRTAREKKEEFFGKRGWTLHTILVFTKNNIAIDVQAFDHWSTDTKQDAWFTASSFDAVFETLNPKPSWIKVLSDNGGHYHCSEIMAIVANWYTWYNIEVRGWYFFEPGEAKSLVDSHHAAVKISLHFYNGRIIRINL